MSLTLGDRVQLKKDVCENASISCPIPGTWFEEVGLIKEFIQYYEHQEIAALVRWQISGWRDIYLISNLVNVNENSPYINVVEFRDVPKVLYVNSFIPISFYHAIDAFMLFEDFPRAAAILCSKTDFKLHFGSEIEKANINGETLTKIVVSRNPTVKEGCKSIW